MSTDAKLAGRSTGVWTTTGAHSHSVEPRRKSFPELRVSKHCAELAAFERGAELSATFETLADYAAQVLRADAARPILELLEGRSHRVNAHMELTPP